MFHVPHSSVLQCVCISVANFLQCILHPASAHRVPTVPLPNPSLLICPPPQLEMLLGCLLSPEDATRALVFFRAKTLQDSMVARATDQEVPGT